MSVITVKLVQLPTFQVTATNSKGSTTLAVSIKRGP